MLWQKCLSGTGNDSANCIKLTSDVGYIFGGNTGLNDDDVQLKPFLFVNGYAQNEKLFLKNYRIKDFLFTALKNKNQSLQGNTMNIEFKYQTCYAIRNGLFPADNWTVLLCDKKVDVKNIKLDINNDVADFPVSHLF